MQPATSVDGSFRNCSSAGHDVRCLVRTPQRLTGVEWHDDVEVVDADVLDRDSLDRRLHGIDVVYYLVHAMGHSGDFESTDRRGAENMSAAAETAGVGHLVYLGGLGDDDHAALEPPGQPPRGGSPPRREAPCR